jgi:PadR family transcriptional regulator AphA
MSSSALTPFSYVILVLVGRDGAGPHDLRRMAESGRGTYWAAAASQFYAEPKRLERLGLLASHREPGKTRQRTHYELTADGRAALAEWVRTPAALPRIQNEPIVRLLAADLVDPAAVLEGLRPLRAEIDEALATVAAAEAGADALPHRARMLRLNHRYSRRLLELQAQWLQEAERELAEEQ